MDRLTTVVRADRGSQLTSQGNGFRRPWGPSRRPFGRACMTNCSECWPVDEGKILQHRNVVRVGID
jgi:hypothetical protein